MVVRIKGHFDGERVVLDEPVDLPAGTSAVVEFATNSYLYPMPGREDRLAALAELAAMALPGLRISAESLLREDLYEDR